MFSEPLKVIQTRLRTGDLPNQRGNCLAAVIASIMHIPNPEDVFQTQLYFHQDDWSVLLDDWLATQGWEMGWLTKHQYDGSYYFVSGLSPRGNNIYHICIYQNGKLWHDPHPSGDGILSEPYMEYLRPIN